MPTTDGFTACQMSMNGCPTTSACSPVTCPAMRDSLEPFTRWSTSTPSRRPGDGRNSRTMPGQVVDAVQRLHDDALDAQVVAPHLLDQLGVVLALDVDRGPRGRRGPGRRRRTVDPEALRCGPDGAFCFGRTRTTGPAVDPEARARAGRRAPSRSGPRGGRRPSRSARPRRRTPSWGPRRRGRARPRPPAEAFLTVRGWTRLSYGERGGTARVCARGRPASGGRRAGRRRATRPGVTALTDVSRSAGLRQPVWSRPHRRADLRHGALRGSCDGSRRAATCPLPGMSISRARCVTSLPGMSHRPVRFVVGHRGHPCDGPSTVPVKPLRWERQQR